jgi:Zn finger protein HypA/HybF involved in hydrogenase expression
MDRNFIRWFNNNVLILILKKQYLKPFKRGFRYLKNKIMFMGKSYYICENCGESIDLETVKQVYINICPHCADDLPF